ncbi:Ras-GAP domain-containing protein [Caenorhabditis elegans]|uniref:Ras-GAP domain-containing protein n=1 Tax=Caenorhabditis elegans TaxID=6239 RepID=Q4R164_CAEEL|nr:Ras-GAP domain-containing protein [Caenorhabditis elegans]CCD83533.1 Ras-GAP domain-containing protein [Caenorhabditis elegans]|eukprot:NP_001033448.1 Uncharacterized protein CELE_Y54G2A.48 [Caenorhabditis elegans]
MAEAVVQKLKSEVEGSGMSPAVINGIFAIAMKYKPEEGTKPTTSEAMMKLFGLLGELEAFINTQSSSNQKVYYALLEKKRDEMIASIQKYF